MTQYCPVQSLKVDNKPQKTLNVLQYQIFLTIKVEIQLDLFKINDCHGNHEHPLSLILRVRGPKEQLRKFQRDRTKCF